MIRRIKSLRYLIILSVIFQSCITSQEGNLFQGLNTNPNKPVVYPNSNSIYELQAGDVLSIKFKSSTKPELADHMNLISSAQFITDNNPGSNFINGYSVDDEGFIYLPDLGKLKVVGLTVEEVRSNIQEMASETGLVNPSVFVNLASFKVSVLGEVENPGYFYVYNNRANVLELLALAGGLREFANPKRITLLRQEIDGTGAINVDLTQPKFLSSPYYYLRPNDIIYVEPLETKYKRSNQSNLNIASVAFAGISTAITVILLIRDQNSSSD